MSGAFARPRGSSIRDAVAVGIAPQFVRWHEADWSSKGQKAIDVAGCWRMMEKDAEYGYGVLQEDGRQGRSENTNAHFV